MKVLITGSRNANQALYKKAHQVVDWCMAEGHIILVGDAPGIDELVRIHVAEYHYTKIQVFGAYRLVRYCPWYCPGQEIALPGDYLARDRHMAEQCDLCVALWNGRSPGTRYTGKYVEMLGKRTIWRVFGQA